MNRILATLAVLALVCLVGTMVLGLSLGDVRNPKDKDTQRAATVHRMAGVSTGILVLLANSFVVTYFVGTSKWCKEVSMAYALDGSLVARSNQQKRRAFPVSVVSMLSAVAIVAMGGAADPGAGHDLPKLFSLPWSTVHLLTAMGGTLVIAAGFYLQSLAIFENRRVTAEIMQQVRRIRKERGLDADEAPGTAASISRAAGSEST